MIRKFSATTCISLSVLLASGGAAFAQSQMQCYGGDPHMMVQTQPIYTGAAPQYVQSSYSGRWTEHEPMAMRVKWTEMARVPSTMQLAVAQPTYAVMQPATSYYAPAAPPPGQPVPAYVVPVQMQTEPQPVQVQQIQPQQQISYTYVTSPGTNPDATTPPGADGCNGERIDATTADMTRRRLEAVGFQNIRALRKGCDSVWHAHAKLNGRTSYVAMNQQGDIYIEKNP